MIGFICRFIVINVLLLLICVFAISRNLSNPNEFCTKLIIMIELKVKAIYYPEILAICHNKAIRF